MRLNEINKIKLRIIHVLINYIKKKIKSELNKKNDKYN